MSMEKSAAAVMTMIIITTMTMSMEKRAAVVMITAITMRTRYSPVGALRTLG